MKGLIQQVAVCLLALRIMAKTAWAGLPVGIDYYYESGCQECRQVSASVLPALSNLFRGMYVLHYRDLGIMSNYLALVRCQQTAGSMKNEPVYMAIDGVRLFSGLSEIQSEFLPAVEEEIRAHLAAKSAEHSPAERVAAGDCSNLTAAGRAAEMSELLQDHFRRFTIFGVMLAGLVDSFNPCAVSTLVFFVSILALAGFRRSLVVGAGICFCAASFLTYIAVGFGLLRFLHAFAGFFLIQRALELGMGGLLTVMAFLSLRDAWRFHRTGDPGKVTLRLPLRLKKIMNALMMRLTRSSHVLVAAFFIGAAVTALETVCTGQVYVPALVLVVKSGVSVAGGLAYLLLYNLMFILPMAIILALAARGLSVRSLLDWSRREVVLSKIALACLFLALAFVLLFL